MWRGTDGWGGGRVIICLSRSIPASRPVSVPGRSLLPWTSLRPQRTIILRQGRQLPVPLRVEVRRLHHGAHPVPAHLHQRGASRQPRRKRWRPSCKPQPRCMPACAPTSPVGLATCGGRRLPRTHAPRRTWSCWSCTPPPATTQHGVHARQGQATLSPAGRVATQRAAFGQVLSVPPHPTRRLTGCVYSCTTYVLLSTTTAGRAACRPA